MRRFGVAYFGASLAAAGTALLVQLGFTLWRLGSEALYDFWEVALLYVVYSFAYTLVLGLTGWALLRVVGATHIVAFVAAGCGLGLIAAVLGTGLGGRLDNPFIYMFTAAGMSAAAVFHSLWYRKAAVAA